MTAEKDRWPGGNGFPGADCVAVPVLQDAILGRVGNQTVVCDNGSAGREGMAVVFNGAIGFDVWGFHGGSWFQGQGNPAP